MKKKVIKLATITDVHNCSKRPVGKKTLAANVDFMNEQELDHVLLLGDNVMDAMRDEPQLLVEDSKGFVEEIERLKAHKIGTLGNHDYHGLGETPLCLQEVWAATNAAPVVRSHTLSEDWLLINLPSIKVIPESVHGYDAMLSDEEFNQFESLLLLNDCDAQPKNVMIMSHVPIMSITPLMDRKHPMTRKSYEFPANHIHADCYRIVRMLENYPQVKLAVSGHMHMVDEVKYNGVSYINCGSLCGMWWGRETYKGHHAGNMFINLNEDGTWYSNYEHFNHVN